METCVARFFRQRMLEGTSCYLEFTFAEIEFLRPWKTIPLQPPKPARIEEPWRAPFQDFLLDLLRASVGAVSKNDITKPRPTNPLRDHTTHTWRILLSRLDRARWPPAQTIDSARPRPSREIICRRKCRSCSARRQSHHPQPPRDGHDRRDARQVRRGIVGAGKAGT